MALQTPECFEAMRQEFMLQRAERQWLEWFFQKALSGPTEAGLRQRLQKMYEKETGRTIPPNYRQEDE